MGSRSACGAGSSQNPNPSPDDWARAVPALREPAAAGRPLSLNGVSSFCVEGGRVGEAGVWIWHGPTPGAYAAIALEPDRPESTPAADLAMATLRSHLELPGGSLTSRLLDALWAAHREVLELNRNSTRADQGGFGVTCVLLRRETLYVARAGPASSFAVGGGRPITMQPETESDEPVLWLGWDSNLTVGPEQLSLFQTAELDRMLLLGGALRHMISETELAGAIEREHQAAAQTLFHLVKDRANVGAVVIDPAIAASSLPRAEPPESSAAEDTEVSRNGAAASEVEVVRGSAWLPRAVSAGLAAVVLLAVLGIAGTVAVVGPMLAPADTGDRFERIFEQALATRALAAESTEPGETGAQLRRALALTEEALADRPGAPSGLELRDELLEELRTLAGVVSLTDVRLLVEPSALGGFGASIDRIFLVGNTLYLLDRGRDRLFAYALSGGRGEVTLVAEEGQEADGERIGGLEDAFHVPPGGARAAGAIVVVDGDRKLFEVAADRPPRLLAVRGADGWRDFQGALGYNGNLYVLDPESDQIWRYFPTESGYDSEPRGMLGETTIAGARSFAIDGRFFVAGAPGWLTLFDATGETALPLEGIEPPLIEPSAIYATAEAKNLYLADPRNGRIVVLDKTGQFLRQYLGAAIAAPVEVVADEENFRLFILSENRVFQSGLPVGES